MRALRDMHRRAATLHNDKNLSDALEIYRQVLAGYEYLLGPDQDDVLIVVARMSHACLMLGHESEAEALHKREVSGYESIHGPDDRRTLFAVACLAYFYRMQGRFEDSEVLYLRAIKGLDQTLSNSHEVLSVYKDLAGVYNLQSFTKKLHIWNKRIVAFCRALGAGYEDALLHAEVNQGSSGVYDPDPAQERFLTDVLAKCEVRYGENHELVFVMLSMLCVRYQYFQDSEKFEIYDQRLCHIKSRLFAKDETISHNLLIHGNHLARAYSLMGLYEAEPLFTRLEAEIDEAQDVGFDNNGRVCVIFELVTNIAEHHIRQSKWEHAEHLLLRAKSLERPFCRPATSRVLVEAFKKFRIGSGREAGGALPLAQRTTGTETRSALQMPGQTVEDANSVLSSGSADFLQPLGEIDFSEFPVPSLPWGPLQPPAPPGATQPGFVMDPENDDVTGVDAVVDWESNDVMGMQDVVDWENSDVMGMQDVVDWENSDVMGTHDVV